MQTKLNPSPPPVSFLTSRLSTSSPSCSSLYSVVENKSLFKTIFLGVWAYIWPFSSCESFNLIYALPMALKKQDIKLQQQEFNLLAKLIYLTGGGVRCVDSRKIDKNGDDRQYISDLLKGGFISRSHFDPSSPYLIKDRTIQKVYISITPMGLRYYKKVVQSIRVIAANDLLKASI